MKKTVLVCSVGGSHEPIVGAIRSINSLKKVLFICSEKDARGTPGSGIMIEGTGSVIKLKADKKATLPNIPTQTKLNNDEWEILEVPADSLETSIRLINEKLTLLINENNDNKFICDYSGGTKTMSCSLVIAALYHPQIDIQFMTGKRTNLKSITRLSGSRIMNSDAIRYKNDLISCMQSWQTYSYCDSYERLKIINKTHDNNLANFHETLSDLSMAFDCWDRFDHETACYILSQYMNPFGKILKPYLVICQKINSDECGPVYRLIDLMLNAERCAYRGKYDDAVARLYRLFEWTVQWLLKKYHNVDTSELNPDIIPTSITIEPNRNGLYQAPLVKAWQILAKLEQGSELGLFFENNLTHLMNQLSVRNNSILAHGFTSISGDEWTEMNNWFSEVFKPMLISESEKTITNIKILQLPNSFEYFS